METGLGERLARLEGEQPIGVVVGPVVVLLVADHAIGAQAVPDARLGLVPDEPAQRDTTRTSDIRFNDYRPAGDAWLSAEVAFLVDGKQRWLEQYTEIQTGTALPDSLFDPRRWAPRKD